MKLSKSVLLASIGLSSQFSFGQISDLLSRSKRNDRAITYNFIQNDQECVCKCCGGPNPEPREPKLRWQLFFMIDSSACVDKYLTYVKKKVEGVVSQISDYKSSHSSLEVEVSFAVFSDQVQYVTDVGIEEFDAANADRYNFEISEVFDQELSVKENFYYLGNGVNLKKMTESAREHFDFLATQHERSGDNEEELKQATIIISQGKTDEDPSFKTFAEDYPTWFMTLTQCTDAERIDSSRDCPNRDVVDSFQLEDFPTRTSFFMYPVDAADTAEMCDQIEETLGQVTVEDKNDEEICEKVGCKCTCTVEAVAEEGNQGQRGPPGLDGRDGDRGPRGEPGPNGRQGQQGPDGERGERGAQGVVGPRGVDGERGEDGPEGRPGERGPPGDRGLPGPAAQVEPGLRGDRGDPGPRGRDGQNGRDGVPGQDGPQGPKGPQGADGPAGNDGRDGNDGQDCQGRQGERGDPGQRGAPGVPGRDGLDGEDGTNGKHGECGEKGQPGEQGKQGCRGDPGAPGEPGPPGRNGRDGERGQQGQQGPPGPPGRDGLNGEDGDVGPPGRDGVNGKEGPRGERGDPGTNGIDGPPGPPGPDGDPGYEGFAGKRGKCGPAGKNGEKGPPGLPGVDGHRGPPGLPGPNRRPDMNIVKRLVDRMVSELM